MPGIKGIAQKEHVGLVRAYDPGKNVRGLDAPRPDTARLVSCPHSTLAGRPYGASLAQRTTHGTKLEKDDPCFCAAAGALHVSVREASLRYKAWRTGPAGSAEDLASIAVGKVVASTKGWPVAVQRRPTQLSSLQVTKPG